MIGQIVPAPYFCPTEATGSSDQNHTVTTPFMCGLSECEMVINRSGASVDANVAASWNNASQLRPVA